DERDLRPVRRPDGLVVAPARIVGEMGLAAAVVVHDVDLRVAVAQAREREQVHHLDDDRIGRIAGGGRDPRLTASRARGDESGGVDAGGGPSSPDQITSASSMTAPFASTTTAESLAVSPWARCSAVGSTSMPA